MDKQFTVMIRDYESGLEADALGRYRVEQAIQKLLDKDGSDGIVIVTEHSTATTTQEEA